MGLLSYTIAGAGFILIGAWESLLSASQNQIHGPAQPSSPPSPPQPAPSTTKRSPLFSSSVTYTSISILSVLFIIDSIISLFDALTSKDHIGSVVQLEIISIAALFLLYSLLGLVTVLKQDTAFNLPSPIMNILCLFAFGEEFFLFYQQRKDPTGVENRYYDLFLVPIAICVFSTMLELKSSDYKYARLGRGVGLILQGMWILQMGFSFFSDLMAHGCYLSAKSRGNYTVKCKGHMEYHRGRAIATLQFNCHLALLVALIAGVYSLACKKNGDGRESMRYTPLGAEMQHFVGQSQFTLDSDDDDDDGHDANGEIKELNLEVEKTAMVVPERKINGYGAHQ